MKSFEQIVFEKAKEEFSYAVSLRRYFHQHPELSNEEVATAKKIEEELKKIGITPKRVGKTGVYGEIIGNLKGNHHIILRADMDALAMNEEHISSYQSQSPGKMHACGHDAHMASLLCAAKILVSLKSTFGGKICLHFQPAEEVGGGAKIFIQNGYLKDAKRCFGIHMASNIPVGNAAIVAGSNNASVDWFKIQVHGKNSHISTPELGVDALYIASQIVVCLQALITKSTHPTDPVILGIGKMNAGSAYNIVANNATLEGTLRTMTEEMRKHCQEEVEKIAQSVAKMYGGSVDIEWKDFASPLVNDPIVTKEVQEVFEKIFGNDHLITYRAPSLSGDDFAEYIKKVPGCYAYIGSRNEKIPETTVAHHHSCFDIDEEALLVASTLYASYALFYLKRNDL